MYRYVSVLALPVVLFATMQVASAGDLPEQRTGDLKERDKATIPRLGDAHPNDESYRLVWQDEFSGSKLDRTKWNAVDDARIGRYGHGNGETQAYIDDEGGTYKVADGKLVIIARHAPRCEVSATR